MSRRRGKMRRNPSTPPDTTEMTKKIFGFIIGVAVWGVLDVVFGISLFNLLK